MSTFKTIESVPTAERHGWELYNHGFNANSVVSKSLPCGFLTNRLFDVKPDQDISVSEYRYACDNKYRHADLNLHESLNVNSVPTPKASDVKLCRRLSEENVDALEKYFSEENSSKVAANTPFLIEKLNADNSAKPVTDIKRQPKATLEAASVIAPPTRSKVQKRIVIEKKKPTKLHQCSMFERLVTTNIREQRHREEEIQRRVEAAKEAAHVDTVMSPTYGFGVPSAFSSCGSISVDFMSDHSAMGEGDWSTVDGDMAVGPKTAPVRGYGGTPVSMGRPTSTSVTSLIHKLRNPIDMSPASPAMQNSTVTAGTSASKLQEEDLELGIFVDECASASIKNSSIGENSFSPSGISNDVDNKRQRFVYDGSMGDSIDADTSLNSSLAFGSGGSIRDKPSSEGEGMAEIVVKDAKSLESPRKVEEATDISVVTQDELLSLDNENDGASDDFNDSVTDHVCRPKMDDSEIGENENFDLDDAQSTRDGPSLDHFEVIQPSVNDAADAPAANTWNKDQIDDVDMFRGADWSQNDDNELPYEDTGESPRDLSRMPTGLEEALQDSVELSNARAPDVLFFNDRSVRVESPNANPPKSLSCKYSQVNGRYIPPTHVAIELVYETLEIPFYNTVTGLRTDTKGSSSTEKFTVKSAILNQESRHGDDNYKTFTSYVSVHAKDTSFKDFAKLIGKQFEHSVGSFVEDSVKSRMVKMEQLEQLFNDVAVRTHRATNLPLIDAPCTQACASGLVGAFASTSASAILPIQSEDSMARPNTASSVLSVPFPSIENLHLRPHTSQGVGRAPSGGLFNSVYSDMHSASERELNYTETSTFNNYKEDTSVALSATARNIKLAMAPPSPCAWSKSMSCITENVTSRPSTGYTSSKDVLRLAASAENLLNDKDGSNTIGKLKSKCRFKLDKSLAERTGPGLNLVNCKTQIQDYFMLKYYNKQKRGWVEVDSELSYAHMLLYGLDMHGVYEEYENDAEALRVMVVSIPHKPLSYEESLFACNKNSLNDYVPLESSDYIKRMHSVDERAIVRSKFHEKDCVVEGENDGQKAKLMASTIKTPHVINGMLSSTGIVRPVTAPSPLKKKKPVENLSGCSVTMNTIRCKTGGHARQEHERLIEKNIRVTSPRIPSLVPRGHIHSTVVTNSSNIGHNPTLMSVPSVNSLLTSGTPISIASYHRNGFPTPAKKQINFVKNNVKGVLLKPHKLNSRSVM